MSRPPVSCPATAKACNGADQNFNCATTDGYDQIDTITQGATENDILVSFKTTYPDWKAVFSAGPNRADSVKTADVFNNGWKTLDGHDGWFGPDPRQRGRRRYTGRRGCQQRGGFDGYRCSRRVGGE